MAREDIEFKTCDNVILRGWFYKPAGSHNQLPCLVMCHGFSAIKEMDLDAFAEYFTSKLALSCLVFDNRGFGTSDVAPGQSRQEIIPPIQCSDIQDAITYAQSRSDVHADRIGVWGSSYSGGHVLYVGAADRRVKAVLSQAPFVNGWETFHRLIRGDFLAGLNDIFRGDRLGRASGKPAAVIPVVDPDPMKQSALPTPDSFEFFNMWEKKSSWKNEVTVKSIEVLRNWNPSSHMQNISPTPLLMTVAENDTLTPTDLALKAYSQALEPKELHILPGGHFDSYSGPNFERNAGRQAEFLKKTLCS